MSVRTMPYLALGLFVLGSLYYKAAAQEVTGTSFRLVNSDGKTLATLKPDQYGGAILTLGSDDTGVQASISASSIGTGILLTGYGKSVVVSTTVAQSSIIDLSDVTSNGNRQSRVTINLPKNGNPKIELFSEDGHKIAGLP